MKEINISRGFAKKHYKDILKHALEHCSYCLYVVQDFELVNSNALKIINKMRMKLAKQYKDSKWPGTELLDTQVDIFIHIFDYDTCEMLTGFASGFPAWQHPDLPEDLCLLREDMSPYFISIAHERDFYFLLQDNEFELLKHRFPMF